MASWHIIFHVLSTDPFQCDTASGWHLYKDRCGKQLPDKGHYATVKQSCLLNNAMIASARDRDIALFLECQWSRLWTKLLLNSLLEIALLLHVHPSPPRFICIICFCPVAVITTADSYLTLQRYVGHVYVWGTDWAYDRSEAHKVDHSKVSLHSTWSIC